jgi:hypothetical protein
MAGSKPCAGTAKSNSTDNPPSLPARPHKGRAFRGMTFRQRSYAWFAPYYVRCDCGALVCEDDAHGWSNYAGEREGWHCPACYAERCRY